jgi:hypothetical protein
MEKWSQGVHVREGKLYGWCAHCPPSARHAALRRTMDHVGYRKTIQRIGFVRNVSSRQNNEHTHEVAERDEHWLERKYGDN